MTRLSESAVIRSWTRADIDYVSESVNREGWGYTRLDVERCWKLEPNGCFIAEFKSKPIGHVFSICYGRTGWIGLLIVNPERRGQGIGSVLMQTAINHLQRAGAETVRLDAAEKVVPLYKRLGFIEEFYSFRFRGQLRQEESFRRKRNFLFLMRQKDLIDVAEFDSTHFGANRLSVLRSLYRDYRKWCFVAREKQCIVGYVMARQIQNGFWIGPWVCLNAETSQHLLSALTEAIKDEDADLRVGLPAPNTKGRIMLEKLGFQLTSRSIHMVLGNRKNKGDAAHVYGIGGPEKG